MATGNNAPANEETEVNATVTTSSTATAVTTQYLDLPGGRIAFDDSETGNGNGNGTPVLLLPGMLDSRRVYRNLRPLLLAAGHRVITMDLRGFGESSIEWDDYTPAAMAEDALALLTHLGIERAALVGSSFTAASVVKAATLDPERVAGITLIDGFIENLPQNAFQRGMVKALGYGVLNIPALWGLYLKKMAYPGTKPADLDEYVDGLVAALRTPGRRVATRGHVFADSSPIGWCEGVTAPALVLMGEKDPDFPSPLAVAERQTAALNGRMVMIEGAGHYPMAQAPAAVAAALLPFLKEIA